MKRFFKIVMAAAVLFSAASCAKEDISSSIAGEETVEVFFATNLADLGTRAYDDGENVTTLRYFVYDNAGNYLSELSKTCNNREADRHFRFSLNLVKSMTYNIYFWADKGQGSPYEVVMDNNIPTGVIAANYNGVAANDGSLDAFYGSVNITPKKQGTTQDVNLTRPFAQLNALTSDWDDIHNSGVASPADIKSSVIVEGAYTQFSFLEGKAVDGSQQTITFGDAVIPAGKTEPESLKADYTYLAMSYLFARDKCVANVTYTFTADRTAGEDIEVTTEYTSVPLKPNFRTNILGALLTNPTAFDVELITGYNPEMMDIKVFNYMDLQAALDAVKENETTTIYLGADIIGDVTDVQKPGRKVTIEGNGHKYNGSIKVHSNSNYYADASLTIKNVNFETSAASINVIEALENGSKRYSSNITVEDCTFTALETRSAVNTAVGLQVKAVRNVTVKDCTATNMHSLIQAQSCDTGDVKVVNCTINGKNGVAFKQVKSATVEGTTITAAEYGIRFDGNTDNYGIVVKENNVTAAQPLIVRRMTAANNTIALEGNTLTTEAEYQIVITNGEDDAEYVKPTGTYTLTGAEGYTMFPGPKKVATWDEFTAALAAGEDWIKFTQDIAYNGNYELKKNIKLDLGGNSITMPMFYVFSTATIKNGTIIGKMYARTGCKVTLEDLTYSGTISDDLSTEGHLQVQGGCDVYAKNCTFAATTVNGSQTRSLSIEASSSGTRKFDNCDFKFTTWGSGVGKYKKNVYINTMSGTTTVEFTNCKLNGKAPNIIFAGTYSLTNLKMSGCDNTEPTLETNRAKDAITDAEWAHISSLIANNKFSRVRLFYAGGSSEYIYR